MKIKNPSQKPTKKQKTLLFDIGNVLLFANHNITHQYLTRKHKIPTHKAQLFFKIPEYKTFAKGKISSEKFAEAIQLALGKKLTLKEIKHAHNIHIVRPIKTAIQVLDKLHLSKKYKLAFLTNTNQWQNEREKELIDFSKYSKIIIRSNEEGLLKENSEIFTKTIKKIGNTNILFIDNSIDNIEVAKRCGLHSLHVQSNKPNLKSVLQSAKITI